MAEKEMRTPPLDPLGSSAVSSATPNQNDRLVVAMGGEYKGTGRDQCGLFFLFFWSDESGKWTLAYRRSASIYSLNNIVIWSSSNHQLSILIEENVLTTSQYYYWSCDDFKIPPFTSQYE